MKVRCSGGFVAVLTLELESKDLLHPFETIARIEEAKTRELFHNAPALIMLLKGYALAPLVVASDLLYIILRKTNLDKACLIEGAWVCDYDEWVKTKTHMSDFNPYYAEKSAGS